MEKTCQDLLAYMKTVGDVSNLDNLYEHAICDCINRLGDSVKIKNLGFEQSVQKNWSALRVITAHQYQKLDFTEVWTDLPKETSELLAVIEAKLE